jgi:hypothetical protein
VPGQEVHLINPRLALLRLAGGDAKPSAAISKLLSERLVPSPRAGAESHEKSSNGAILRLLGRVALEDRQLGEEDHLTRKLV